MYLVERISDKLIEKCDFCFSFKMEKRLREAIEKGLDSTGHKSASVKCFPTYVRELPSGAEVGKFLALDLGGTNFRVVIIDIGPDQK